MVSEYIVFYPELVLYKKMFHEIFQENSQNIQLIILLLPRKIS